MLGFPHMLRVADVTILVVEWIGGGQGVLIGQKGDIALRAGKVVEQDSVGCGLLVCCNGTGCK